MFIEKCFLSYESMMFDGLSRLFEQVVHYRNSCPSYLELYKDNTEKVPIFDTRLKIYASPSPPDSPSSATLPSPILVPTQQKKQGLVSLANLSDDDDDLGSFSAYQASKLADLEDEDEMSQSQISEGRSFTSLQDETLGDVSREGREEEEKVEKGKRFDWLEVEKKLFPANYMYFEQQVTKIHRSPQEISEYVSLEVAKIESELLYIPH
jgi:hypothetical protein